MLQKVRSFDVFGKKFSLDTKRGSATHTTAIGGLISIIAFALFSLITYILVSRFLDTSKPVVSVNRVRMKEPLRIDFFDYDVLSGFACLNQDGFMTIDQSRKYLTIKVEIVTTTKDAQGNSVDKVEPFEVNTIKRLKSEEMKELATDSYRKTPGDFDYFAMFGHIGIFPDIEPKDMYILGSKFGPPYRRLQYRLYPCSYPNPADCASFEELAQFWLGNAGLFKSANYSSKSDPFTYFADLDNFTPITAAQTIVTTTYLKQNFIYNDDRDLMDERLALSFVDVDRIKSVSKTRLNPTIHCTAEQIEGGSCEPYMELVWRSSFDKMVVQRRYKTPFGVFSEIGGFCDLITYGLLAIYFYYNTRSYARFVRSQLVDGYLELDQKRLGEGKKRSAGETRRLKSQLMEMDLDDKEAKSTNDRLPFKQILRTEADLESLIDLSFKSKILVDVLINNQALFNLLSTQLIYLKKKSKKNSKNLKVSQHEGLAPKKSSKPTILNNQLNLQEKEEKKEQQLQKDIQKLTTKGETRYTTQKSAEEAFGDEDFNKMQLKQVEELDNPEAQRKKRELHKTKSLASNQAALKQRLAGNQNLVLSFSRRLVSSVENSQKKVVKKFQKKRLGSRPSSTFRKFGKKFGSRLRKK